MRKQNNNLQLCNLFIKVKVWIYKFFHKTTEKISLDNVDDEIVVLDEQEKGMEIDGFLKEYKLKSDRRKYLLDLQRKYKAKEIFEEDMSEIDRVDLENLYVEQNNELKRKIRAYDLKIRGK